MKKQLISLAVAAAMVTPVAAMAEATLYGKLHQSIDYVDVDAGATWGAVPRSGSGDPSLNGTVFVDTYNAALAGGNDSAQDLVFLLLDGAAAIAHPDLFDGNEVLMDAGEFLGQDNIDKIVDVLTVHFPDLFEDMTAAEILSTVEAGAQRYAAAQAGRVGFRPGTAFKGWDLNANGRANRVGVKGSEDLGGGLKAIYQVEFQVRLADANNNIADGDRGSVSMRNSFVGLAGNWGTFLVGRHDTPFKISSGKLDLFSDTLADYNHTIGFHDVRADNAIAYISPSFSGLQFAGAIVPSGGSTPTGVWNPDADGIADAYSVALIYSNGPFYASAAYESLGDKHWDALNGYYNANFGKDADDDNKWRIGLGILDWNGFTLTGIYENRTNVLGAPKSADYDLWQVQAGYSFGNNTIKAMYGQADLEKCTDPFNVGFNSTCSKGNVGMALDDLASAGYGVGSIDQKDKSAWAVGFDHNFSKRTRAYMLYTKVEDDLDDGDWSGFSLGMIHSF